LTSDGTDLTVGVWGRRVEDGHKLYGLWILVAGTEPAAALETLLLGAPEVVLAVTDHDWQIEYMSADAGLLGTHGSELRGFPLLGMVHPSAASEFLAAAVRCAADHIAVTALTRLRTGPHGWADRYCLMVPICDHQPPRLGVVISPGPTATAKALAGSQLDEHVRDCAVGARAARTLETLPALATLPSGSELSARQSEIVARLVAGERVPDIARSMFLSASTVRNHLSAIYQKFGVHSQGELLAALLRALARHEQ
jgi:DNA-binding CsgD family transcriptional regulator